MRSDTERKDTNADVDFVLPGWQHSGKRVVGLGMLSLIGSNPGVERDLGRRKK